MRNNIIGTTPALVTVTVASTAPANSTASANGTLASTVPSNGIIASPASPNGSGGFWNYHVCFRLLLINLSKSLKT